MCGIAGIVNADVRQIVDRTLLRDMTDSMLHRGPDGDGIFIGEGVGLGHRRLSIIDLAGGAQPMHSPDGRAILTYNGEIYNYLEIRAELEDKGFTFLSNSDTEVVLNAYLAWGRDCVKRFRGMFAFAIWDCFKRKLFIARDRLGIKPLYYCRLPDGSFLFASEMKALLKHSGVSRKIRLDALDDYLALGFVPETKAFLKDIEKLEPGCTLEMYQAEMRIEHNRYWQPDVSNAHMGQVSSTELLDRLEDAVKMRMISDVPLGAFLSGGVDSSTIVALMAKHTSKKLETCAIGSDDEDYDESGFARTVADHVGTHHRLRLSEAKDTSFLDIIAQIYDEPFADISSMPTYKVSSLAREKVTVCLSGDGGDELFGGYRRHKFHLIEEKVRAKLPFGFRRAVFGPLGLLYPKLDWAPQFLRAKSTFESLSFSSAEAYFNTYSRVPDRDRYHIYSRSMRSSLDTYHPSDRFQELADEVKGADPLSTIQYIDLMHTLPGDILTKVDRASMANSLEVRVPILDHKFVEWALTISPEARIEGGEGKAPLKRAARTILPHKIVDRPKKGFIVPLSSWFREELRDTVKELSYSERLMDSGLFNAVGVRRMVDQHVDGIRDHHLALWSLLVLDKTMEHLNVEI